ncbi:molybdenum cofactor biosysynthesis protein [Mycolicibacterium sp. GF69]|uniref:MOSC domain-containing protein n=1 Tax=Mycolicibacterium sp. GF69 TaxID=2267251 RepID=UPI000DCCE47D|nr:MOSC N-terminal beta barrel domain-containing protein [Mycolicibacterium sp. GF69]RAV18167.1 molybdenum cofactor biosysynthesis protein [Mycolicibacterium sp. GF69]
MTDNVGRVAALRRYPVKSMLGERRDAIRIGPLGVAGDRQYAVIDEATGRVATAKHPRRWRALLQCAAATGDDGVVVTLPDGRDVPVTDAAGPLSELLGRTVQIAGERAAGAVLERSDPLEVLARGIDAEFDPVLLELGQGAPGGAFVDHSPVHLISTTTLDAIGVDRAEAIRYRPNVVIETADGAAPFLENDWVGAQIHVGEAVLRGTLPTPRCAVPTLEHGGMQRLPHAVRYLLEHNRVEVPDSGALPCAGLYAEVVTAGAVGTGDEVRIG